MTLYIDQVTHNVAILKSIKEKGLTRRQVVSIGGVHDNSHSHLLCYNGFSINSTNLDNNLQTLCYEEMSGLWSIGIEGVGMDPAKLDAVEYERIYAGLQNSIVFLFEITPAIKKAQLFSKFLGSGLITQHHGVENTCREYRTNTSIAYEKITAILVPRHLVKMVETQFPEHTLIAVDDIKQSITTVPWMATPGAKNFDPTKSFKYILTNNNRLSTPQMVVGANYLQGLKDFIQTHPHVKKIGVHLTRLSTPAICQKKEFEVASSTLTATMTMEIFNEIKDKFAFSKLLLKNLKPQQFQFLNSHPHMTLIKYPLVSNSYYVLCHSHYKPLLTAVINDFAGLNAKASLIKSTYQHFAQKRLNAFFNTKKAAVSSIKRQIQNLLDSNDFAGVAESATAAKANNDEIIVMQTQMSQDGVILTSAKLR